MRAYKIFGLMGASKLSFGASEKLENIEIFREDVTHVHDYAIIRIIDEVDDDVDRIINFANSFKARIGGIEKLDQKVLELELKGFNALIKKELENCRETNEILAECQCCEDNTDYDSLYESIYDSYKDDINAIYVCIDVLQGANFKAICDEYNNYDE